MVLIERAGSADLDAVKTLCDAHRLELGFVMRPSLAAAIQAGEVLLARDVTAACIGFMHYHHRRDTQTTLYHIAVRQTDRGQGVGRALIQTLGEESHARGKTMIRLKCPESLSANGFYSKLGFVRIAVEPGKVRPLWVWELQLESEHHPKRL